LITFIALWLNQSKIYTNKKQKNMKRFYTLLIFILYLINYISAQSIENLGSPFIRNFTPIEYKGNNQNWCVLQDDRGIIYFGNTNGVLEYDGKSWKLISTTTSSIVRTLAKDNNSNIFVGGNGDFGCLTADSLGVTCYKSLVNKLPEANKDFTDIRKLVCTSHGAYFFTKNNIFQYINDTINIIPFTAAPLFVFNINDIIFAIASEGGIYSIYDGKLTVLPGTFSITENSGRILIVEYDNENIMIITENNGIFIYNIGNFYNKETQNYNFENLDSKQSFYVLDNELNNYFLTNKIYCGIQLDQQNFAVGTVYGGLVIFDNKGKLIQIINKNRGLLDEAVIDVFLDRDNNLWLAQLQGIAYVDYNNPITKFQDFEGIEGSVSAIIKYKNLIFAATSLGLFYLPTHNLSINDDKLTFKIVPGTLDRIWELLEVDNYLIASSSTSLKKIKDTTLNDAYELKNCYTIYKSPLFENKLFIGLSEGFASLDYSLKNNKLEFSNLHNFEEIKSPIREIITFDNNIWLTSSYDGVFRINFPTKTFDNYEITHFDTLSGLPKMSYNYVLNYNNIFLLGTDRGTLNFNGKNFEIVNVLNCPDLDTLGIANVIVNNEKTWVLTASSQIGYLEKKDSIFVLNRVGLVKIMGYSVYNMYFDDKNILWLSTNEGVFRYDTNKELKLDKPYKTLLRKIIIGKDSVIFNGTFTIKKGNFVEFTDKQPQNKIPVLDYKTNSILFDFCSTFYETSENNLYSFYLAGFENEWNQWTSQTSKEYTFLTEGKYTFHLKSINIYGNESEITIYSFSVEPPWYRTIIAYIIYFVALTGFIFLIVYLNTRRLKTANLKLEKIIEERTSEIRHKNQTLEQQKEEILAQAEQLEVTNKELEKLSIVASETDNAVLIMDSAGTFEWGNEGFTRLYGYTFDEFVTNFGKNILTASTNRDVIEAVEKCIKAKKTEIYESEFKTKTGQILWLQTTLTPILNKNDEVVKLIAIESDIRKLKEYESEILQKNEEINTQKEELEIKNQLLEQHNENIKASIRYAKTIQNAILPFQENINKLFENFILYLPKDIVSGDFYWFSHYCKTKTQNATTFFAVVDCTGHGVPGAFMSMIGSRLLNEVVNEKKIFNTDKILAALQRGIEKALRQDQTENNDGMDVCLCKIEDIEDEKYNISFTGAKRSLYYFEKSKNEVHELKADRISIGGTKYTIEKEFTVQNKILAKNDILYFSTDGYIDQNNRDRKRFGSKEFVENLTKISNYKMEEQCKLLSEFLYKWMDGAEQRDDITVIGLKL